MPDKAYFEKNKIAIRFESFDEYKQICERIEGKKYCDNPRIEWKNGWTSFYHEKRPNGVTWVGWTQESEDARIQEYQVITFDEFLFLTSDDSVENILNTQMK
jgi:hypothetical protein